MMEGEKATGTQEGKETAMIRYLPVNTRVVLEDAKHEAQYYTTKKEIEFTEATVKQCPLRAMPVQSILNQGFTVYFQMEQVRTRSDQTDIDGFKRLRLYKLTYYIPSDRQGELGLAFGRHGHPSGYLRRIAVWSDGSAWYIPENKIPWAWLNELSEVGGWWDADKLDSSEAAKLIDRCVLFLTKSIKETTDSAENSQRSAEAKLVVPGGVSADDPEKIRKKFLYRAKAIQKEAKKRLEDYEAAAVMFGLAGRGFEFAAANAAVDALKNATMNRARLYVEAIKAAKSTKTADGEAVAKALENHEMPPDIAADFLQDQGKDAEAEALRAAFTSAPEAGTTGTEAAESNEYSLVDPDDKDAA
jgi:hypothetical protein